MYIYRLCSHLVLCSTDKDSVDSASGFEDHEDLQHGKALWSLSILHADGFRELGVNPSNPEHGLDLKSSMLVAQSRRKRLRNIRLCCPLVVARKVRLYCPLLVA